MAYPPNRMGCLGLMAVAMFLLTFSYLFTYERRAEAEKLAQEEHAAVLARQAKHSEGATGPEFTTMDFQLSQAKEAGLKITEFRMEAISEPIKGPWVVKDVGYDVVLLEGPEGVMTVKMDVIVSILVEPKKTKELEVEKVVPVTP